MREDDVTVESTITVHLGPQSPALTTSSPFVLSPLDWEGVAPDAGVALGAGANKLPGGKMLGIDNSFPIISIG
jgi:hypothetical protein